jgi:hypothetical protein
VSFVAMNLAVRENGSLSTLEKNTPERYDTSVQILKLFHCDITVVIKESFFKPDVLTKIFCFKQKLNRIFYILSDSVEIGIFINIIEAHTVEL